MGQSFRFAASDRCARARAIALRQEKKAAMRVLKRGLLCAERLPDSHRWSLEINAFNSCNRRCLIL
jgi:hypothetical protein